MSTSVHLVVPLPLGDVLTRLIEFGRDARDSKFPVELRKRSIYGAAVVAASSGFRMTLEHRRRDPQFVLRAVASQEGSETMISGTVELTSWNRTWIAIAALVILALFLGTTVTSSDADRVDWVGAAVFTIVAEALLFALIHRARLRTASDFKVLLKHATSGSWKDAT